MRVTSVYSLTRRMVGNESPWGWMTVGFLLGVLGAVVLVLSDRTGAVIAGIGLAGFGGVVVIVSARRGR
jgi:hypothetical protein